MIRNLRYAAVVVAVVSYLVMGAMLYFTVIPGANGHWPPDFHLRGYSATSIAPFVTNLSDAARATYGRLLTLWDPIFIAALAGWLWLMGWRGGGLRYVVVGLALIYGAIDLAEDAAIYRFMFVDPLASHWVDAACHFTMAKFASLYLCILVLIWHVRRTDEFHDRN